MIILPTAYRPESLKRFAKCYQETGATLPVYVVFDFDNAHHYTYVELPGNFTRCAAPPGARIGDIFNMMFEKIPDAECYGILADDVIPTTYRWDILLKEACMPDKIAWGFDGGHDETLPRHPFIGGNLVRKLGFVSCPDVKHWYVDNAWQDIAQGAGIGEYRPEIRMVHEHYTTGRVHKDRTYLQQPDHRSDEMTYREWKEKDLPSVIQRLTSKV